MFRFVYTCRVQRFDGAIVTYEEEAGFLSAFHFGWLLQSWNGGAAPAGYPEEGPRGRPYEYFMTDEQLTRNALEYFTQSQRWGNGKDVYGKRIYGE